MMRKLIALLVISWTASTVLAEVEPNDALAEANAMGALTPLDALVDVGAIGDGSFPEMDVDVFSFAVDDATAPILVTINVGAEAFDSLARLFDASGAELARNDDRAFGDENPHIQAYVLVAGTYFVAVGHALNPRFDPAVAGSGRPFGVGGDYRLSVSAAAANLPASSFEPNDDVFARTDMGSGSFSVSGEFIGDGAQGALDVDVYTVSLAGAARIDVRVHTSSIGSILRPVVRVRSCTDPIEALQPKDPCGLGESVPLAKGDADAAVSTLALDATDVYIMVSGQGNRRYDPAAPGSGEPGSMGAYDLDVVVTSFDPFALTEPNDSVSSATEQPTPFVDTRPDTITYQGFLGDGPYALTRGDRDYYEIQLLEGARVVTFEVVADDQIGGLRPTIAVYDADRKLIAANDNPGELGAVTETVLLDCTNPRPVGRGGIGGAPSFVLVMSTGEELPADVVLPIDGPPGGQDVDRTIARLTGTVGGYELRVTAAPTDGACGAEPNNTLATAASTGLIDEGVYICEGGLIGETECGLFRDVDTYSVRVDRVPADLEIRVSVCEDFPICDAAVIVFDAGGTAVASFPLTSQDCLSERSEAGVRFPPVSLEFAGTYFVAVTGGFASVFDPTESCPAELVDSGGSYGLTLSLSQVPSSPASAASSGGVAGAGAPPNEVFVTRLDDAATWIDVLDPQTLLMVRSFLAPEPRFGGGEGLAYDGTDLYYLGSGQHPILYRLDPSTGTVLDSTLMWMGSGYFSDATVLGGTLYILDAGLDALHAFDLATQRFRETLPVGWLNGIGIGGGLTGVGAPNRLYVADAFDTGLIYELHPAAGVLVSTITPVGTDQRPVSLASNGEGQILMGDRAADVVDVLDRTGVVLSSVLLDEPAASMGGLGLLSSVFDINGDGSVDLRDYAAMQVCFDGEMGPIAPECFVADRDADGAVDLADADALITTFSGP